MLNLITPIVLTYNESENIQRTLEALGWAKEVIVIDSFSTDDTQQLCAQYANVTFVQHAFESFAKQWEYAIHHTTDAEWILALDADHVVSDALVQEMSRLEPTSSIAGYRIGFIYKINGKAVGESLYPPLVALYRREQARYSQDGHAQRIHIDGDIQDLRNKSYHDDRKPMSRWLNSQWNYAQQEAEKLASTSWSALSWSDRIRKLPLIAPIVIVPLTLFAKGMIFRGKEGWLYTSQRLIAELLIQYAKRL